MRSGWVELRGLVGAASGTGVVYDSRMLLHRTPTGKHPEQVRAWGRATPCGRHGVLVTRRADRGGGFSPLGMCSRGAFSLSPPPPSAGPHPDHARAH